MILQMVRDFLMQCFQKDPNLRVSARKLLKHSWIVNAKRSDAVVPKKPTQYDEAVKSVQEWNEALKSPNAGSLRKASRPMSSSPIPGRREKTEAVNNAPARASAKSNKAKVDTEQFRSPSSAADDNWDDDFDSAISPTALQLPHLKPHDRFGGLLSSEKLKAFASFETVAEESNWDENFEGEITVKSPLQPFRSDPLETIRPINSKPSSEGSKKPRMKKSPSSKRLTSSSRKVSVPALPPKSISELSKSPTVFANAYAEGEDDDFSDLIADDSAFEMRVGMQKVCAERDSEMNFL